MSRKLMRYYRFATEAQWNACVLIGADRDSREARNGVRLFMPYAGASDRFATSGGFAPAISCASEVLWRNGTGKLHRLPYADDELHSVTAPYATAHATRLVATTTTLWAAGDGSLQGFDLDTLARQMVVDVADATVLDIAGDGHDGLFVLLAQDKTWSIAHVDCAGHLKDPVLLDGIADPSALVYLGRADRLVVLAGQSSKLHWFARAGGLPKITVLIAAVRPCFNVAALGSDGRARLFLGGTDGAPFGGRDHVLTLDTEGNPLGDFTIDETPTGIAANRSQLLVTGASGLQRFGTSQSSSRDASEVRATIITPMLESPSTEGVRRWLRAEALVKLPSGCALEFSYAATNDRDTRDEALRITADPLMAASQRLRRLQTVLGPWRTISFHGEDATSADAPTRLSAPLFDIHEQYLWVSVALIASPGGGIPALSELTVFYPGETLMENLPSIYQRLESQPESFLRSLVGVLESTTQTLDARIAELGRLIDPHTAPDQWLNYIARWLGLPWDDALSLDQKRNIATHAAEIAAGRGTRAGLEALLRSLMPDTPQRFRVVDSTADFGIATVGGAGCAGSSLPTVLGGLPSTATELGSKTILGKARLPCGEPENDPSRLVGRIRIDISADAYEQAAWQPWLRALIDEIVPATARTQLRWLSAAAFHNGTRLDDSLRLEEDPEPHLGTDAVTGLARLPGRRGISLSASGTDSDSPLH
jgi:phage tail-like protein